MSSFARRRSLRRTGRRETLPAKNVRVHLRCRQSSRGPRKTIKASRHAQVHVKLSHHATALFRVDEDRQNVLGERSETSGAEEALRCPGVAKRCQALAGVPRGDLLHAPLRAALPGGAPESSLP